MITVMTFIPLIFSLVIIFIIYWTIWCIKQYRNRTLLNTPLRKVFFIPALLHGIAFCLFWLLSCYVFIISIDTWSRSSLSYIMAFFWEYFWWYWGGISLLIWCFFMKMYQPLLVKDISTPLLSLPTKTGSKSFLYILLKVLTGIVIFIFLALFTLVMVVVLS